MSMEQLMQLRTATVLNQRGRRRVFDNGHVAFEYLHLDFDPKFRTVQGTTTAINKLDEIRFMFRRVVMPLNFWTDGPEFNCDKLFNKFRMDSLSLETENPIIPTTNLDFSSIVECFRQKNGSPDVLKKLIGYLCCGLLEVKHELDAKSYADDQIADFISIVNDGICKFVAIDAQNEQVGESQQCSTLVHNFALARWRRNPAGSNPPKYEKLMYIYLYRNYKDYGETLINDRSTHPSVFDKMLAHHNQVTGCEMFGSVGNAYMSTYGSLNYDIEQFFGSVGSAAFILPIKGLFYCDVVPSIGLFNQLCWKRFFSNAHSDVYIYIKMQGGWGMNNQFHTQLNNHSFKQMFLQLANSRGLWRVPPKRLLWDCLAAYNKSSPETAALNHLMHANKQYLKPVRFYHSGQFPCKNYLENKNGHWPSEIVVYLLSNRDVEPFDLSTYIPGRLLLTQIDKKQIFDEQWNSKFIHFCAQFMENNYPPNVPFDHPPPNVPFAGASR